MCRLTEARDSRYLHGLCECDKLRGSSLKPKESLLLYPLRYLGTKSMHSSELLCPVTELQAPHEEQVLDQNSRCYILTWKVGRPEASRRRQYLSDIWAELVLMNGNESI